MGMSREPLEYAILNAFPYLTKQCPKCGLMITNQQAHDQYCRGKPYGETSKDS